MYELKKLCKREKAGLLRVLWDKWKHADDLMYRRWTAFWTTQAFVGGASLYVFFNKNSMPDHDEIFRKMAAGLILIFASLLGFIWWYIARVDHDCRNVFNPVITNILTEFGALDGQWKYPDSNELDHNMWHTPNPKQTTWFRGSIVLFSTMLIMSLFEFVAGLAIACPYLWAAANQP
ncbi:MAG: hypothetical protein ACPGXK_00160 [Phycisphaerae bacterium]